MTTPLNRETITRALGIALRDQSTIHERDDHAVIRRFLVELGRTSWISMAIDDYEDLCCVVEGSE